MLNFDGKVYEELLKAFRTYRNDIELNIFNHTEYLLSFDVIHPDFERTFPHWDELYLRIPNDIQDQYAICLLPVTPEMFASRKLMGNELDNENE